MEELYGDRTAGFHGYSHLTGGFDGGQAEYARVPFGEQSVYYVVAGPSGHEMFVESAFNHMQP